MSAEAAAVWCCSKCGAVYHKDFPRCPNDGAEVVLALRDPLLDQSIGHYVIDRLIGEGGMGRVYAAHHTSLQAKRYAIKVLLGDVAATSSMRRRFAMEAESASRLDHPNVVHVIDFGEMPSGLPYIVMDFVDGVALTELIDDFAMDPARVIRLARAVCEGLAYAHDANVIHRDLKPDNIMVVIGPDGSEIPRIADFGLATTVEPGGNSRLTTTGMAMGTPAYAAPEQMAGKRVDHKADLYALGMTMFEMLTGGTLPFEGHPLEMMTQKAHKEAPTITQISPTVVLPRGLEELVASLIRRKAVDRPASAREVIEALDKIVLGTVVDERAATAVDTSLVSDVRPVAIKTEGIRRRARVWPWLAATIVVAAAGAGTWWWTTQRTQGPAPIASTPVVAPTPPPPIATPPKPVVAALEHESVSTDATPPPITEPRHRSTATTRHVQPRAHKLEPATKTVEPPPPVDVPPPPPPPVVETPPPAPKTIVTQLASVDVQGALSQAQVRRAIERVMPALRACAPTTPQMVQAHFTIDESRRAQQVSGSASCVVAALAGVRTETAPDVGDATVDVKISFVAKP